MSVMKVVYEFFFPDKTEKSYVIQIDKNTMTSTSTDAQGAALPAWTLLENNKCAHCPLNSQEYPHCPIAADLSHLVEFFVDKISFTEVGVRVTTPERAYVKKVALQDGIFGVFGLIMATSRCPHMSFLKPMARYHLPFSSAEETIVRSVSMYLLGQYFVKKRGGTPDLELEKLQDLYQNIQKVNMGILARIRSVSRGDADLNAITVLHSFASLLNMAIDKDLTKIEPLFTDTDTRA